MSAHLEVTKMAMRLTPQERRALLDDLQAAGSSAPSVSNLFERSAPETKCMSEEAAFRAECKAAESIAHGIETKAEWLAHIVCESHGRGIASGWQHNPLEGYNGYWDSGSFELWAKKMECFTKALTSLFRSANDEQREAAFAALAKIETARGS
jgi:hypothetical protein